MNLLFDNIVFSLQPMGGISIVWSELLKRAMRDDDVNLHMLVYPNHNKQWDELSFPDDLQVSLPYRTMERYRTPDYRSAHDTVFHSSYFRTLPHTHNITTIHDLTYHFYRRGLARAVHLWEEERALRHSERIICVSGHTRNDLLRTYSWLDADKVHVIYNGVSEVFRPMAAKEPMTPFEIGSFLLYVGNRKGYKNWQVAVGVARETRLPIVMVGAPPEKQEQTFLEEQLGKGHFACLGFLSEQQLCSLYNQALALIYPSEYEGFGLPVLEAQRCGCPVLIQAVSSLPEVAGDGAMIVEPQASRSALIMAMSEQINHLKQGSLSRSDLQQRGIQNVERFSWDECYRQTKKVYQSI